MGLYLDGRTSQNASYANSIFVPTTPAFQLFGQIGLDVSNAGVNTSLPLRVQLNGIITLSLSLLAINLNNLVEILIVRGSLPTDMLVFSGIKTLTANGSEETPQEYSFTASDFNVPRTSNLFVYTAFVRNQSGSPVTRVGPESFNGEAIAN